MRDELLEDLVRAYESAVERTLALREEWEQGRPIMARGSAGQPTVHPLHRALIDAERHEDHLRQRLQGKPGPGRPPEAVIEPGYLPPGAKYPNEED